MDTSLKLEPIFCEPLEDPKQHWPSLNAAYKKDSQKFMYNPPLNKTHPYNQNCQTNAIQFRKNAIHCPAVVKVECKIVDPDLYDEQCPFDSTDKETNEYCECMGLIKEKLTEANHRFYCTCTHDLDGKIPRAKGSVCSLNYLFTKSCVIHKLTQSRIGLEQKQIVLTTYSLNCSFEKCYDKEAKQLTQVTSFNTECTNTSDNKKKITFLKNETLNFTTNSPRNRIFKKTSSKKTTSGKKRKIKLSPHESNSISNVAVINEDLTRDLSFVPDPPQARLAYSKQGKINDFVGTMSFVFIFILLVAVGAAFSIKRYRR